MIAAVYTFAGQDKGGLARTGVTDDMPADFAEKRYRQGWRWLRIADRDDEEVGGIGPCADHPQHRTWWGTR